IREIERILSRQLAAILHHTDFQKLEGSWRGLHHLVTNSETGQLLKIKVLNVSKRELFRDLSEAVESDQSQLFQRLYTDEVAAAAGEPYGALIADYEFDHGSQDVEMLKSLANVAAAASCPVITAPSPGMFGFESWTELSKPRDAKEIFKSVEHVT